MSRRKTYVSIVNGVKRQHYDDGTCEPPITASEQKRRDAKVAEALKDRQFGRHGETDDVFAKRPHFSEVYGEEYADHIKAELAKQGVHMTAFTDYEPQIAQHIGDPRAVVGHNARTQIKTEVEKLGVECEQLKTQATQPVEDPYETAPKLSESSIEDNWIRYSQDNPEEAANMSAEDARDLMIEKYGSNF